MPAAYALAAAEFILGRFAPDSPLEGASVLDQREEGRVGGVGLGAHAPSADVQEERAAAGAVHVDADRGVDRAHRLVEPPSALAERLLALERAVELVGDPLPVEPSGISHRDALWRW